MTCLVYSNPSSRSRSGLDVGCGAFRRGFTGGAVPSAAGPRRRQRAALGIWPALRVTGPREPGPPSSLPAGGASSQVAPDGLVCSPEASRDFPGRGEEGVTEEARVPCGLRTGWRWGASVLEGSAYRRHVEGRLWLCCSWLAVLP